MKDQLPFCIQVHGELGAFKKNPKRLALGLHLERKLNEQIHKRIDLIIKFLQLSVPIY